MGKGDKGKFIIKALAGFLLLVLYIIFTANLSIGKSEENALKSDLEVCENSFKMDLIDEYKNLRKQFESDGKISQSEFVVLKMKLEECYNDNL
ncbi:hypothetical protein OWM07_02445 [Deferribacter thermophilus]|uniref:hypothetical protein n=1 Tax=Deferribacter thermophilus TaxID=53573 RepID=UPI003C241E02